MSKYYYKKRRNNYNDYDAIYFVIVCLIVGIISFILKNWLFFLILLIVCLILVLIYILLNKKSNFNSIKYYEGCSSINWLNELEKDPINNEVKIKKLKSGIYGENNIIYTLLQSNIPMYILHDLVLYDNGRKAQIDVVAITKKCIYVIESKNIKSNLEVLDDGTIIRNYSKYKRGFKNPITQNDEHKVVLNNILKKEKIHMPKKYLVVLTNNDSYIKYKGDNKSIREKVLRNDKLISYIKKNNQNKIYFIKEEKIKRISNAILKYTK